MRLFFAPAFTVFLFLLLRLVAQGQIQLSVRCVEEDCGKLKSVISDSMFEDRNQMNAWMDSLLFSLRKNGYPAADFEAVEARGNSVIAYLNPGPEVILASIQPGNIDERILKKIRFREHQYHNNLFRPDELYTLLSSVAREYADIGYPFARVYLGKMVYRNDTVQALLQCEPGPVVFIDTVVNSGNLEVNSGVLYAMAGIAPGDIYNYKTLSTISERLKKYTFIREAKPPEILLSHEGCVVNLFLDKRAVNTADGIVGFMPDYREEGKLFLTGELLFSVTNSMDLGETVLVRWRQPERFSQTLKTGLMLPSLILTPFGLNWDFHLQKKDTVWISTDNKILLSYPGLNRIFPGVYVQYFSSSLISVRQFESFSELPPVNDMNVVSFGLEFVFDSRDFSWNPRSGINWVVDCSAGKKTIIKNNALDESIYKGVQMVSPRVRAVSDFSWFIPVRKNSCLMLRVSNGIVLSEKTFENEMFRLGGLNNMRGFEEDFFYSTSFGMQTIEYRYLFSELSRFVVFADWTYIEKSNDKGLIIQRPFSAGAGVTLETGSGLFSLFWAVGKLQNQPPDFRGSKIHFGYSVVF